MPLLVLLITGKGSNTDLWGLFGVGALMVWSVAQYFTYRYRIESDGVVIRSGLFQRSARHIPFARIQNVSLHQSLLHRLFNVAEVRLESAGAAKPEGQMRVLRLDAAHELEQLVRTRGAATAAASASASTPTEAQSELLLALPVSEVVRLGLINNRGMLVVGGMFAVLAQTGDNMIGEIFKALGQWFSGQASAMHLSLLAAAAAAVFLLLAVLLLLRLLSVAIALLQFHGFRLSESQGRLSVERGLFTRLRSSVPRHRIQAYSLSEGMLHRLFHRQSLRVDTAVMEAANESRSLRDLAPIATPEAMDGLLDRLLPENAWPISDWQPLHPRAWRRKFTLPVIVVLLATTVLVLLQGTARPRPAGGAALALLARGRVGQVFGVLRQPRLDRVSRRLVEQALALCREPQIAGAGIRAIAVRSPPWHGDPALRYGRRRRDGTQPGHSLPARGRSAAPYESLSNSLGSPSRAASIPSRTAASAAPAP